MNYSKTVTRYVVGKLSVLTDQQIKSIDFETGISVIESSDIANEDKEKLKRILIAIQKEVDNQLTHYGVLGMKWGVRRYQNKDGSLTPAGEKKYRNEEAKKSIFGTAKTFVIKTRSGETITAEPVKPPSMGTKIFNAIMGISQDEELGYRGDANYTLMDSKGNKIGELSFISKDADTAYLDWITIYENQRGKGYATDIINNAISQARESGYKKIELNALKKPRALYERMGFTYTDTSKMSIIDRVNSFELGCKHMEYDLTLSRERPNNMRDSSQLTHYGVLGMKWGRRRYQNADGSLTSAGKKRYGETFKDVKNEYKKRVDDAYRRYEKEVADIEKPYKRGQNLSDKDYAREEAADKKYNDEVAKAKADYKAAKAGRKGVDQLHKAMSDSRNYQGRQMATVAAMANTTKKDRDKFIDAVNSGRLIIDARMKKNYKDQSVDVYIGEEATPTMRMRMEKGKTFTYEFLDANRSKNYADFVKYINERDK